MTFYLGLDPGFTTGAAWVSVREKKLVIHDFEEVIWPTFLTWVLKEWEPKMEKFRQDDEPVRVVVEDYIHRKAGPWTPSPVTKMIGFTYCKALELDWTFHLSQPTNKTAGYRIGKIPKQSHWADALAHVYFAVHRGLDPDAKIIW